MATEGDSGSSVGPGGSHELRAAPYRPVRGRSGADAQDRRPRLTRRADLGRTACGPRRRPPAEPARPADRRAGPGRAAPPGRAQPGAHLDDRPGLLRHRDPRGDPAQPAGEPRLVHGVHALPAGDIPGPAGGAAQLPDHGRGPDRAAGGRRVHAGRGDRGRRSDDPGPAGGREGPDLPGRCRLPAADPGGAGHPGRAAGHRAGHRRGHARADRGAARGRAVRGAAPVPGRQRRGPRPGPRDRGGPGRGRAGRGGRRPARADPAPAAGGARRGHRGRHHAAVRRADGLRRAARGLYLRPRGAQTPAARPAGRGLGRRRRPSRLPARAAGPRAAHPPGEGDQQYLHRAGAARGDRGDVRRLPRPGRADRDRAAGAPPGRCSRADPAGPGVPHGDDRVLRHRPGPHARGGGRRRGAGQGRWLQRAPGRGRRGSDRVR